MCLFHSHEDNYLFPDHHQTERYFFRFTTKGTQLVSASLIQQFMGGIISTGSESEYNILFFLKQWNAKRFNAIFFGHSSTNPYICSRINIA